MEAGAAPGGKMLTAGLAGPAALTHRQEVRFLFTTVAVAGAVLALDMTTKLAVMARMAEGESIPVIAGLLTLHYVRNPGAAYGLLSGQRWALAALAAAVALGLLWYARNSRNRLERVALGLILGGALGNLIDRLRWGLVTDFLEINPLTFVFQVFNVADMGITFGVVLLIWGAWQQQRRETDG